MLKILKKLNIKTPKNGMVNSFKRSYPPNVFYFDRAEIIEAALLSPIQTMTYPGWTAWDKLAHYFIWNC